MYEHAPIGNNFIRLIGFERVSALESIAVRQHMLRWRRRDVRRRNIARTRVLRRRALCRGAQAVSVYDGRHIRDLEGCSLRELCMGRANERSVAKLDMGLGDCAGIAANSGERSFCRCLRKEPEDE